MIRSPAFDTPEPILASIEIPGGEVRISASDRADAVVEVRPRDESQDLDVQTAESTQIDYAQGRLLVKAPLNKGRWWLMGWDYGRGAVEVTVELPAGSRVDIDAIVAEVHCQGRLGEAKVKSLSGTTRFDQTGRLRLGTAGDVSVQRAAGQADVTTANGDIWIGEIDGPSVLSTSNGDIWIGETHGDAQLKTASGDLTVDRAHAGVNAKTPSGDIRIGEVARGKTVLETGSGRVEVGIGKGSAAWLDVQTHYGSVRNALDAADSPTPADETVEVRARTAAGDIVIRRA
jgi:hypothetical protein